MGISGEPLLREKVGKKCAKEVHCFWFSFFCLCFFNLFPVFCFSCDLLSLTS